MKNKSQNIIQFLIVIGLLLILNLFAQKFYTYIDLTEDKRFTIEKSTVDLLEDIDENILIEILLAGDLDANLKQLQARVIEIAKEFKSINSNIDFKITNPSEGTVDEVNQIRENLRKDNINPTTVFIVEKDKRVEKLIYPYAIVNLGERRIALDLLEPRKRGESEIQAINTSMILLEYKFASTLQKLFAKTVPNIVFTKGNGELLEEQTAMLELILGQTMATNRINLDSTYQISQNVDVLIVARPTQELSLRNKFIIDQYIMNGGKVIWLVEQFFIDLDSINNNKVYLPRPVEHGLDDMFFKYGIRINKDVILDLENSKIPQVYGTKGGKTQQKLFPWVYYPLLVANPNNAIVRNLDRVFSTFPSSIELLDERKDLTSDVLLSSSTYSRYQIYPSINISFEILRLEQRPEAYNKPNLPVAVMVEGQFESFFKNRVSQSMSDGLKSINAEFQEKSPKTSQVFITDAEIIKNLYKNDRISPMGFNKYEGFEYKGNRNFMVNIIDYLVDEYGLVDSRSKNLKVRMIDQVQATHHKLKWQIINILLPILIVVLGGFIFTFIRKRKYTS